MKPYNIKVTSDELGYKLYVRPNIFYYILLLPVSPVICLLFLLQNQWKLLKSSDDLYDIFVYISEIEDSYVWRKLSANIIEISGTYYSLAKVKKDLQIHILDSLITTLLLMFMLAMFDLLRYLIFQSLGLFCVCLLMIFKYGHILTLATGAGPPYMQKGRLIPLGHKITSEEQWNYPAQRKPETIVWEE